jgi:hypothetical protein
MNKLQYAVALSAFGLSLAAANAMACGESSFHSGSGMRYHAFVSRHPADILFYRPGILDEQSPENELYAGLQRAGHRLTVVTDGSSLTQALGAKHYDVIIASEHDIQAITAQLDKSAREPALLAVVDGKSDAARLPHSLREDDGLNEYLKSIEQTMQTRGT